MHDVIIVGTGYAGVWALQGAADAARHTGHDLKIAIISPAPTLVARPRLYEARLTDADAELPLAELIRAAGAAHVAGTVTGVDGGCVAVERPDGSTTRLSARSIVVATGSGCRAPDGIAAHSLDTRAAAVAFWRAVDELAARAADGPGSLAIVGAGATGLEAAAEAASLFGDRVRVHLLDPGAGLRGWSDEAGAHIGSRLEGLGVKLHFGAKVVAASPRSLRLADGRTLPADLVLWTAGMRPNPLVRLAAGPTASDGRVLVDRYLRQREAPDIFWAGDVAAAPTDDTGVTLMSCQFAMQMGTTAGRNAALHRLDRPLEPFAPRPYVTCLGLGDGDGVFTEGADRALRHAGPAAARIKKFIVEQAIVPSRSLSYAA